MDYEIELWSGIRHNVPMCCILFYESAWYPVIRNLIDEYAETMTELTDNGGIILCPDCLTHTLQNRIKDKKTEIEITQ
ncbi:MAG: hypothetical protein COW26_01295 [Nitrosopumilales archaeon CG15_BIG_FIL_POST_REV_8_21_14_020_33_23]|nr:MAG: hypothetical protein COW26_01295 [Nitrosopumilales archaeon CG15_BIG_FIL_POST_REV_8_21_14_020_33_23]